MATQAEKFKEMANAIRVKTGKTDKIVADNFASEIMSIDRLKPMTLFPTGLNNGYYGNRAALTAATYLLARSLNQDTFVYSQSGPFTSSSDKTKKTRVIRDENGAAEIDCSTFVGLAVRGIPYEKSPYALHKGVDAEWNPSTELSSMYDNGVWAHILLDKQFEGIYNDIGIEGYSSIRTAADLGEYFYKYGYVIFDEKVEGAFTESKANNLISSSQLRPGDIIFWSKTDANQIKRFRSISHVAIVSENPHFYIEVTTGSIVVQYESVVDYYNEVSLICRPKYKNYMAAEKTPTGENLLNYPWVYGSLKESTYNGITFTIKDKNTIHISGTNSASIDRNLKGYSKIDMGFKLSAGTYQLSGMDNTGVKHVGVSLYLKKVDGTEILDSNGDNIRCYSGHNPEFTLSEDTDIIVILHFGENSGSGYTVNCDINPTLTRIS